MADEEVIEFGWWCEHCGYFEGDFDNKGKQCRACGCSIELHVPVKIVRK